MLTPEPWLHSQLVVTTALILTFSPKRRDSDCMYLFIRLCVVQESSRGCLVVQGVQAASLMGEISERVVHESSGNRFSLALFVYASLRRNQAGLAAPKRSVGGGEGRGEGGLQTKIEPPSCFPHS